MAKSRATKILGKADFLNSSVPTDFCEIPELGGKVLVRSLSGKSMLAYNERIKAMGKDREIGVDTSLELMSYLISLTVLDEQHNPMFTEQEALQLVEGNVAIMLTLTEKAMKLSGIDTKAIAEVKSKLKNAKVSSSTAN